MAGCSRTLFELNCLIFILARLYLPSLVYTVAWYGKKKKHGIKVNPQVQRHEVTAGDLLTVSLGWLILISYFHAPLPAPPPFLTEVGIEYHFHVGLPAEAYVVRYPPEKVL